ncbi:Variant surface glycoprotein [Trypanosoma rangeli]|uniref:Variant surface glycoprotein n=1 Tax=Trypanosoma rangeli TaxID=5698 RepID=A0A3R7L1I6_TRYRA|nr:Variant surface glycoprotein [Trypanosoma rangeli]RNF05719.1 Variant surface glycoprotein [Trypanosoma rangeli]|eukprot:RNF05719.1 Variant surface glycoprotein [Trypanosoma rangeli]
MIFGSEPPLYLKPVGRRGLRRHDADVLQHYPGYVHPVVQFPGSDGYIGDNHRLHPFLTSAEELRHERVVEAERRQRVIEARRRRYCEQETSLRQRREEEFQREQRHKEKIAGLSIRNEPGDGRDTITQRCVTVGALRQHEYTAAAERHKYFVRQRRLFEKNNVHGYNIITGGELPSIVVPPMPVRPPAAEIA